MKNASISLRLTFWYSAMVLCGLTILGVAMWVDLAYSLNKGRDRTLARRAARFLDLVEATRNDLPEQREARFRQLAEVIPEGNLIQLFGSTGQRYLPRTPQPADFPWPSIRRNSSQGYQDLDYGGRPFRLFRLPIHSEPSLVLFVAGQLEDNRNMLARLTMSLAWWIPGMLVLSGFGGYFLSRRVLQPVAQITASLRSIGIGSLSQRLPISHARDELQCLAETCNEMLARLENAVERINRFTADASHELRSPVALIRTVAEYALRNPRIDADSKDAFEEILAESVDTGHLLEDMLTLARADAGYANAVFEPVELRALIEDVCVRVRPRAEAKQQLVAVRVHNQEACIFGDRSSIRRLLFILLDNAIKFTPGNGRVEVELTVAESRAVLTVKDSGIGIPNDLLPRIFDRFFRADPSRGEVNGTGLGLAIAKWIAEAHHATLSVQSLEEVGSAFTVEFPLPDRPPASPGDNMAAARNV